MWCVAITMAIIITTAMTESLAVSKFLFFCGGHNFEVLERSFKFSFGDIYVETGFFQDVLTTWQAKGEVVHDERWFDQHVPQMYGGIERF